MRHLPKTYTEADQRADRAFLVGTNYGVRKERQRILDLISTLPGPLDSQEAWENLFNRIYPKAVSPVTPGVVQMANDRADRWMKRCAVLEKRIKELEDAQVQA